MKKIAIIIGFCSLTIFCYGQNNGGNPNLSTLPKASALDQSSAKTTGRNQLRQDNRRIKAAPMQLLGEHNPERSQEEIRSRTDGRKSLQEKKIISRLINKRSPAATE